MNGKAVKGRRVDELCLFSLWVRHESRPFDTREYSNVFLPTGEFVLVELIQVIVTAGSCHNLYQLYGRLKEVRESLSGSIDVALFA